MHLSLQGFDFSTCFWAARYTFRPPMTLVIFYFRLEAWCSSHNLLEVADPSAAVPSEAPSEAPPLEVVPLVPSALEDPEDPLKDP